MELTVDRFRELLKRPGWAHSQAILLIEHHERREREYDYEMDQYVERAIPYTEVWGQVTSTFTLDGVDITIRCAVEVVFDDFDPDHTADFCVSACEVEGATVIDDDYGEAASEPAIIDAVMYGGGYGFWRIDIEDIMMQQRIDDFDLRGSGPEVVAWATETKSVRFTGDEIAHARSYPSPEYQPYSGALGYWEELVLWRTYRGRFVCQRWQHTQWSGERDRVWVGVCHTARDVQAFFGSSEAADMLYARAGIDALECDQTQA